MVLYCNDCAKDQDTGKFCKDCGAFLIKKASPKLDEEFAELVVQTKPQIIALLKKSAELLKEAVALSDATGVPFAHNEDYIPNKFYVKFEGIDYSAVERLTDISEYCFDNEYSGWVSSSDMC